VRADELEPSASDRTVWSLNREPPYRPLTGVETVSEPIEISAGTWEVPNPLPGKQYRNREVKRRGRMAESAIVAAKRVTIVEQRAGRKKQQTRATK
jgi:hypothetical protein